MTYQRYVAEIFGYPPSNKSSIAQNFRTQFICPFTREECDPINKKSNLSDEKTGKLLLTHQSGACSAWCHPNWSKIVYSVIICPFRFREGNIVFKYVKEKFFKGKPVAFVSEVGLQTYGRADWLAIDYALKKKDDLEINNFMHVEFQGDATTGTRELVKCVRDFYNGEDISKKSYHYGLNSKASVKGSSLQMIDKGFLFKKLKKRSLWIMQDYFFIFLRRIFPFKPIEVKETIPTDKNVFFLVTKLNYLKSEDKYQLEIDKLYVTTPEELKDSIIRVDSTDEKEIEKAILEKIKIKFFDNKTILL